MSTPTPTSGEPLLQDPPDFSLVLGGPLYQLFRRAHLAGEALELMRRRVITVTINEHPSHNTPAHSPLATGH
jgi:hypothetical protein